MIRRRIRIMRLVAVALTAGAGIAPAALAMPQHGAIGLAQRATDSASVVARVNPDQQAPAAVRPSGVEPNLPATPMARVPLDQSAPTSHATPSGATPTGSFDWTALGIGIGVLGVLVLIGVLLSVTRRSRDLRRERAAATS